MDDKAIIHCEKCNSALRVPFDQGTLKIRCPQCQTQFIWKPNIIQQLKARYIKIRNRSWSPWLQVAVIISLLFGGFSLIQYFEGSIGDQGRSNLYTPSVKHESQWVRISYDDLVDKKVITHSGQTIKILLDTISKSNPSQSGGTFAELQPYLEPFNFICNDIVVATKPGDVRPHLNVVADYPAGSRQPAWAALFREGHYQLFVGDGTARLFLKGKNPVDLFNRNYSVIRHPLREALSTTGAVKMNVEVYAFENDYTSRTINLDINPHLVEVDANQLGPKSKPLPLSDLAAFFNKGVILEAAEIDRNANFYLYGTPSASQTLANRPQSLEDFAVVYRSIFHHGYNAPYISLDSNEDNRYAKVNFGGLLEDTRVGSVVLEADKLFKTMSTGLDPNTRSFIKGKIVGEVPGFLTEDERSLNDSKSKAIGRAQIRYWFYPDKIRCATDGRIGVVENYQLLADAERMDIEVALGQAQRDTIDHLNNNFEDYARALSTYRELNTVGRLMAIVTWIGQSMARNQVDLDALLAVELSPFKTPRRTKKLLAVTAKAYASGGTKKSIDSRCKVYSFDKLLQSMNPTINDIDILDLAQRYFDKIEDPALIPSNIDNEYGNIKRMKARLEHLETTIKNAEVNLNRYSEFEINRVNAMIDEFNSLLVAYNNIVDSHNKSLQDLQYNIHSIVSVGGGINLRPKDFAKPLQVSESSQIIQRIRSSGEIIRSSSIAVTGKMKSAVKNTGEVPPSKGVSKPWKLLAEKLDGDFTKRQWAASSEKRMSVEANMKSGYMHHRVTTSQYFSEITMRPGKKEVVVMTSSYPAEIVATGTFSQGGTIVLRRGKKIERHMLDKDQSDPSPEGGWIRSDQCE